MKEGQARRKGKPIPICSLLAATPFILTRLASSSSSSHLLQSVDICRPLPSQTPPHQASSHPSFATHFSPSPPSIHSCESQLSPPRLPHPCTTNHPTPSPAVRWGGRKKGKASFSTRARTRTDGKSKRGEGERRRRGGRQHQEGGEGKGREEERQIKGATGKQGQDSPMLIFALKRINLPRLS